jgi:integrase
MQVVTGIYETALQMAMQTEMNAINPTFGALWFLGCETGLRIGDILRLTVRTCSRSTLNVIEQKTAKERRITLSESCWDMIDSIADGRPSRSLVFPMTRQTAHRHIVNVSERLGLKGIGCHSMRKIFAWNVYRRNYDINEVKKELNHKYLSTTILYLLDGFKWASIKAIKITALT